MSKKELTIEEKGQAIGCLVLIVLGVVIWFWVQSWESSPDLEWHEKDNSAMAIVQVQNKVRERLVSPGTARFSSMIANRERGQVYNVIGFVDSENRLGATLRSNIIAQIEQVNEGVWELRLLELE